MPSQQVLSEVVQEAYSCFFKSSDIAHFLEQWIPKMARLGVSVEYMWLEEYQDQQYAWHWYFESCHKFLVLRWDVEHTGALSSCLNYIMHQYDRSLNSWSFIHELDCSVVLWSLESAMPVYANRSALSITRNGLIRELAAIMDYSARVALCESFSDWLWMATGAQVDRTDFVVYEGAQPICRFTMRIKEWCNGHILLSWNEFHFLNRWHIHDISVFIHDADYLKVMNGVLKEKKHMHGVSMVFLLIDMGSSGVPEAFAMDYTRVSYQRVSALIGHYDKVFPISDKEIMVIMENAPDDQVQQLWSSISRSLQDPFLYYDSDELNSLTPRVCTASALRIFSDSSLSSLGIIAALRSLMGGAAEDSLAVRGEMEVHDMQTRFFLEHTLMVYYQPILNMRTGRIEGVEALSRLKKGGVILSPDQFIKSMTVEDKKNLTMSVIDQSIQAILGRTDCDLWVSVNLDLSTIRQDLLNRLQRISVHWEKRLVLELLEGNDPVNMTGKCTWRILVVEGLDFLWMMWGVLILL